MMFEMTEPKLTILGAYRPQVSAETWKEQWEITEDDDHTREHFDRLVLIEAVSRVWSNHSTWCVWANVA
jgi:hypothetical protein